MITAQEKIKHLPQFYIINIKSYLNKRQHHIFNCSSERYFGAILNAWMHFCLTPTYNLVTTSFSSAFNISKIRPLVSPHFKCYHPSAHYFIFIHTILLAFNCSSWYYTYYSASRMILYKIYNGSFHSPAQNLPMSSHISCNKSQTLQNWLQSPHDLCSLDPRMKKTEAQSWNWPTMVHRQHVTQERKPPFFSGNLKAICYLERSNEM